MAGLIGTARTLARSISGAVQRAVFPSGLEHYVYAVRQDATTRNPVVVIHGIMGARLEQKETGRVLWGGTDRSLFADPEKPEELRAVSFPMSDPGVPLSDREDGVVATGSIHSFRATLAGLPLSVPAYGPILDMLGVGGFLKEDDTPGLWGRLGDRFSERFGDRPHGSGSDTARGNARSNARSSGDASLDYDHRSVANCFEFFYDWRRSVPDNAERLKRFIENVLTFSRYDAKLPEDQRLKVDIVAHSMGGLLVRYFLRYGGERMPEDGSDLEVTWEGSKLVENAILVGTPSAGSLMGVEKHLGGLTPTPATPGYPAGLLNTFPAIYQLMPRSRHERVVDRDTGEPLDLYDVELWRRMQWGLFEPGAADVRAALLPDAPSDAARLEMAAAHVDACLHDAAQFHRHMDRPARLPDETALHLFAGDGVKTPALLEVGPRGHQRVVASDLGDGTVIRASALMDERPSREVYPRLITPIHWTSVSFVPAPHMVLTRHPSFINNALYILLEKPRPGRSYAEGSLGLEETLRNPDRCGDDSGVEEHSEPRAD
ncbi:MAG: hypothetical protein AAF108_01380 [Planctomycetota bacterium]